RAGLLLLESLLSQGAARGAARRRDGLSRRGRALGRHCGLDRRRPADRLWRRVVSDAGEPRCEPFTTASDRKSKRRADRWMLVLAVTSVAAAATLRWRASLPTAVPWCAVGAASLLALQAGRAYFVFLRGADELLRKIQLEALAWGFGAGGAVALLYPLWQK